MRRLRKIAVACLVWATAASMLLGSTPHVICLCPNGQVKHFCGLSTFAKTHKSCCCNGSCCSPDGGKKRCCKPKPEQKPSCCAKKNSGAKPETITKDGAIAKGAANNEVAFRSACCQKTIEEAKIKVLSRAETKPKETGCSTLILLANADSDFIVVPMLAARRVWRVDWSPPPTDLITSLQRLTI